MIPVLPGMIQSYDEEKEYNLGSWEGNPLDCFASMITGIGVSNVVITGGGVLDGNAANDNWWEDDRAQIKAMKKIAGPIRIELAQFRELAAFSQFSSDLDPETKAQLAQGERIREILKQDQYNPMPVENEVMIIYAATKKYLIDIELDQILEFEKELFEYVDTKYPEIPEAIRTSGEMSAEIEEKLVKAIEEIKEEFTK